MEQVETRSNSPEAYILLMCLTTAGRWTSKISEISRASSYNVSFSNITCTSVPFWVLKISIFPCLIITLSCTFCMQCYGFYLFELLHFLQQLKSCPTLQYKPRINQINPLKQTLSLRLVQCQGEGFWIPDSYSQCVKVPLGCGQWRLPPVLCEGQSWS